MRIRKILVPTDFSESSLGAVDYAVGFAGDLDAEILLVHVLQPAVHPLDYVARPDATPAVAQELRGACEQRLQELLERELGGARSSRAVLREGHPFVEIVRLAREEDVDLIVIATHGHTGIKHMLLGSTAEKVVRKAPCPVLTVKSAGPEPANPGA